MLRIARLIIECTTPLHCGGGMDDQQDQPVLRDAFGLYRIPGSTIAGVLRTYARNNFPEELVDRVFGAQGDDFASSLIWCNDGCLLDFDGIPAQLKEMNGQTALFHCGPYIRDHVRIDLERGAAENAGKFDEEIVPPGTRFSMEIALDGWAGEPGQEPQAVFDTILAALKGGRIRFGGKAASGYGRFRVLQIDCREFDLRTEAGMVDYLNMSKGPLFETGEGKEWEIAPAPVSIAQPGVSGYVELPLATTGPLLVGSGASAGEADITFLTVPRADYEKRKICKHRVVPGSSFRGVVRHRVYHIAGALGFSESEADSLLDSLFGSASGDGSEEGSAPGKLAFFDAVLPKAETTLVQHVAIDRFTGGALQGALYNEAPVWDKNLHLTLRIEGRKLQPQEAGILLHALMDLSEGMLPVGSGGNRGNGALQLQGFEAGQWTEPMTRLNYDFDWDGESFTPEKSALWLQRLETALQARK